MRLPMVALAVSLGLSIWAALLGWLVSPWLEMYGLAVVLVLYLLTNDWRKKP